MLDTVLPLSPQPSGAFLAHAGPDWFQGRGLYGGLPAAWLAQAGEGAVSRPGRRLRSLTVHLAAPVPDRPVSVHAEKVREGTHISQVIGRVTDDRAVLATMVGTWGRPRSGTPDAAGPAMPAMPRPDDLPRTPSLPMLPAFARHHVDYRFVHGAVPGRGADAHIAGWARFDPYPSPTPAMLVALADVWPPAILPALDRFRPAATVDLSLQLHAPLRPDARPEDFYAYEARISEVHEGYAEERASLWDLHGRRLMSMRQTLVVFG